MKAEGALAHLLRLKLTADADKILAKIAKLDERIETAKVKIEDRESNKTVALGTSKMNYIVRRSLPPQREPS